MKHAQSAIELKGRQEIFITMVGIVVTLLAATFLTRDVLATINASLAAGSRWMALEQIGFSLIFAFLIYGSLAYQVSRLGYFQRLRKHKPATATELDATFDGSAHPLTILVPSYREEERVIWQTLMSAALQDYPRRRVVLLIDDPPHPTDLTLSASLEAARRLPATITTLLREPHAKMQSAWHAFQERATQSTLGLSEFGLLAERHQLAELHREAAEWFETQIAQYVPTDHTDRLFASLVLERRLQALGEQFTRFEDDLAAIPATDVRARLAREYRHLASIFDVEITCFERKKYANLSHAPNKAMNLNSYIGLMGGSYRAVERDGVVVLEETSTDDATLTAPATPYVITLDADSLLSPDYALRLINTMEQPGHERLAVVQTPYSSIPEATGMLERVAGATTDIQYIIHQGFTRFAATFWVGANALLRKSALDDIMIEADEDGVRVKKFIQDRTVIEDTESSVDLVARGWQLFNYPERLSYSATPPDFGSLLIQRRRWANGGLLIMPKLLRYILSRVWNVLRWPEGLLRAHYLTSIATANFGLLIILVFPLERNLEIAWLPVTAIPYYYLYARDLVQSGYRYADLIRVYALNLLLIPIHLGGVIRSIHQAFTGRQIAFKRTPKIRVRTDIPVGYLTSEYALAAYCLLGAYVDFTNGRVWSASFAFGNVLMLGYAIGVFIGFGPSLRDLAAEAAARLRMGIRLIWSRLVTQGEA